MKIFSFLGYFTLTLLTGAILFTSCNDDDDGANNEACFNHGQSDGTVTFDAGCSENAVNYEWNFGNGDEVSQIVPTFNYLYPEAGTYTVTLLVTFNDGSKLSTSDQVTIAEICLRCTCSSQTGGGSFIVDCATSQSTLQLLCSPSCTSTGGSGTTCSCSFE